jgi:LmbE family N-acetylglucosaminyl deacetylase
MDILYVYPHPDDESFGPALAIARQVREGHRVFLLTSHGAGPPASGTGWGSPSRRWGGSA